MRHFNFSWFKKKNIIVIFSLTAVIIVLLGYVALQNEDRIVTTKMFMNLSDKHKIHTVILDGDYLHFKAGAQGYKIYKEAIDIEQLLQRYPVEVKEDKGSLYDLILFILLMGSIVYLFRQIRINRLHQLGQMQGLTEEPAEAYEPIQALTSSVTFKDVAGIKDVKEELEEIIDFLRNPQKYRALDIRLPKGVLLVGPPGVGKTLISKAVAGEAGVPFFYQSGASFVHIYVGMGARRVSELFKKAKQMAPSIIFIDEIDAVGKSRGEFRNDEREATLNQLLTEMDGFEESAGVIVIGATNKIDVLDEALLRAGRFDRRIHISLPDLEERAKTLALYLTHKPNNVNIETIAHMTVGFNSAALDTLTNEAAIHAMRGGRKRLENSDFEAVKEKVLLGKRRILSFTEEERNIQAVYQGAKAIVAAWTDVEFEKIGIVTTRLVLQEHEILSRSRLVNRIQVYLAGSIATKLYYKEQFTNGSDDIRQAKELVNRVIYTYAMSENFIVTSYQEEELLRDTVSEVSALLKTLEGALKEVTAYLLEHENITQERCKVILQEIF